MRDSQYKSCAVQNQFTAYLIAAIRNYKRTYLRITERSHSHDRTENYCCEF